MNTHKEMYDILAAIINSDPVEYCMNDCLQDDSRNKNILWCEMRHKVPNFINYHYRRKILKPIEFWVTVYRDTKTPPNYAPDFYEFEEDARNCVGLHRTVVLMREVLSD